MKKQLLTLLFLVGIFTALYSQLILSPYTGQEHRQIKALSEAEINALFSGAGMGFAKAAELNHYPGPKHVLELADQLKLTDDQIQKIKASFDKMNTAAVALGKQVVHSEKQLDDLFKNGDSKTEEISNKVDEIAQLTGRLRFVHLKAHLEMKNILSEKQIQLYDQLRGYAHQDGEKMDHPNHHH